MSSLKKLGQLNREGMKSFNDGRMDDALFQLMQADHIARSMQSPLHEAKVRNNIGLVHQMAGEPEAAKACFSVAEDLAIRGAGEGNTLHKVITRNMNRLEQAFESKAA